MSKSRTKVADVVFETVATELVAALERGTVSWPLPNPPISDPEFPPIPPTDPGRIVESGLAMLQIDRGMFDYNLNSVVDLIVPHRMNLSDDPFEVHSKWLLKRVDKVSERMLFAFATHWLAQAFDPYAPNADRWWLAIALIDGLATTPFGQPVHQGYHLVESIALAERPGTWHTQPDVGPSQLDWNPQAVVPRNTTVVAHENGVISAKWLLERLENGDLDRRLLLLEWTRLLLERPALVEALDLSSILLRRASDSEAEVASRCCLCLAKLIEADRDAGIALAKRLHERDELLVRRGMADVLTRLFRRLGEDAIPFLEDMLLDQDEGVLAAASATVSDLRFLDMNKWADKVAALSKHELPVVRRNLAANLRDYVTEFPDDSRGIVTTLWQDGDEVVRTRLRELLLRMEEVDLPNFANRIKDLADKGVDLDELWTPMDMRRSGRSEVWKKFLVEGEIPIAGQSQEIHISNMQEVDELPQLEDALDILDQELGFLD